MLRQGAMPLRFAHSSGALALDQATRAEMRGVFADLPRRPVVIQAMPAIDAPGAEAAALWAAEATALAGGRSIVAAGSGPADRLKRIGADHAAVSLEGRGPIASSRNVARLKKLIGETGADIIHARTREIAWAARQAARDAHTMVVTSCGTDAAFTSAKDGGALAEGDCIVAGSAHVKAVIAAADSSKADRIAVIPDGADLSHYSANAVSAERLRRLSTAWGMLEDPAPTILAPGPIEALRGQHALARAMALLAGESGPHGDVTLIIAGSPKRKDPYAEQLSRIVQRSNLAGRVFVAGELSDLPAAMLMADIVVSMPTEPLGQDPLAAMAAALGKPVVGADHGATAETVEDRVTGRLASPLNPEGIAAACRAVFGAPAADRNAMAEAARARAERLFSAGRSALATARLYGALLASTGR